jgi:tRNA(Arg) A34 adenosine deaminase TadA
MHHLNNARRLASRSPQHFKHSAIVFRGGAVLASASNDAWEHAEVRAVRRAASEGSQITGTTVLSVRVTEMGLLRNAKPCPACMHFMRCYGVRTVLYSTANGQIERIRL